jgi:putative ABC transport system permease protein
MESLTRDLEIAIRKLLKSPAFTLTAVLMLALGIGATTAIFSIVEGVLLRPLPFPEPERLVALGDILEGATKRGASSVGGGVTSQDIVNYTRYTQTFTNLGGYRNDRYELSGVGEPATIGVAKMTAGVFPALAVGPLMGRVFTQDEDEQQQQVAVLAYSSWQSRFHGDPNIIGKKILLDRKPYLVIGVMPTGFEFPLNPGHLNQTELWIPMSLKPEEIIGQASSWQYQMVGRLKRAVSIEQATSDAERVAVETMRNYPGYMRSLHITASVKPLHDATVADARPLVRTLFLAVCVVLLIACANLAGLLLVRAIRQQREMAVRLALGATATTLLRQMILESLVLSVTGAIVGLALAGAALNVGLKLLPENLPRIHEIGLDWMVVAFAIFLALLTGVLCGLAPGFAALRTSVSDTLKEGGRTGSTGGGHGRLRSALVVAEIAVAMVLATASGLLLRSFERMRAVELGFRPDHTIAAAYSLPQKQYPTQSAVNEFNNEVLRRLAQLPGVSSVGLTTRLPASDRHSNSAFVVEGFVPLKGAGLTLGTPTRVEGDYFRAMGISLLHGRLFTPEDKLGSQLVVIVNPKLAEHYWPGQDPVGKRIRMGLAETPTPWMVVVGEVNDVKLGSPDEDTTEQMYEPITQASAAYGAMAPKDDVVGDSGYISLRTELPPEQIENSLRATVQSIDSQLPLTHVQTMEHAISDTEAPRKFYTALIVSFALAAMVLAGLGIYSVIAFSVALRSHEIAIRMALGSSRTAVVRLVLISGTKLAVTGCAIGLLGSIVASRLLGSLLFEVSALDPLVMALSAILVLLLALAACLLPARRASAVEPMEALRAE